MESTRLQLRLHNAKLTGQATSCCVQLEGPMHSTLATSGDLARVVTLMIKFAKAE